MRTEELKKIEEILDVEENTISEETELASLEEWDSVAKLSLTIMLEEDYGKKMTSEDLKNHKTVKMILDLMK